MRTTRTALAAMLCMTCLALSSTRVRAQDEPRNHEPAGPVTGPHQQQNEDVTPAAGGDSSPEAGLPPADDQTATRQSARRVAPTGPESEPNEVADLIPDWGKWTRPERLTDSLRLVAVMATLSLAPALLLMTTCYVRIVVVLSLLRQALGSQQLPPNQVTTTLALFLTLLIMFPVWKQVHEDAIEPYTNADRKMTAEQAWTAGVKPVREFMSQQIDRQGNRDDVLLFLDYLETTNPSGDPPPQYYSDVPLQALLPAFLLSELKVAFLIGFQVFLPFVIIDLVVSSVTMSMGMVMVPPTTISLPMKLVLFVLADGWHLVVEMLLKSFHYG